MIHLRSCISSTVCRSERLESVTSKGLDPMLHSLIVSVLGSPVVELVAESAWLKDNKAGVAIDTIAVASPSVLRAVNLDELDLIASILSGELIHDFIPFGHEFDAVVAGRHEEIDYNKRFRASINDQVLELV